MDVHILTPPKSYWECPNCTAKDVTTEPEVHTRFHNCSGLKGITAPMVPVGTRCRVYTKEREDYINNESVQVDGEGRPIMAVITEREDGQDCAVLAPVAGAGGEVNI